MNQNSNEHSVTEDEINLYDLWKVIAQRKKLIIGIFLISVIAAAIISLLMPKVYRGTSILMIQAKDAITKADIITAPEIVDVVGPFTRDKIKSLCPINASSIVDIKLTVIKQSKDKIMITVEAKNRELIPHIIKELLTYLNNNPIIKRVYEQTREDLINRKKELSALLEQGELTQKRFEKFFSEGKMSGLGFNPVEVDSSISGVKMQIIAIDLALKNPLGFEMMDGLIVPEKPIKPRIKMNIALAGMASFFAGVFLAFFLEFIAKMKNRHEKNS